MSQQRNQMEQHTNQQLQQQRIIHQQQVVYQQQRGFNPQGVANRNCEVCSQFCPNSCHGLQSVPMTGMGDGGIRQLRPSPHDASSQMRNQHAAAYPGSPFGVKRVEPGSQEQIQAAKRKMPSPDIEVVYDTRSHYQQAGRIGVAMDPQRVEEQIYIKKVRELGEKYIKPLQRAIGSFGDKNVKRLKMMKDLLQLLENPPKKMPMELLLRCESALGTMDFRTTETVATNPGATQTRQKQPAVPSQAVSGVGVLQTAASLQNVGVHTGNHFVDPGSVVRNMQFGPQGYVRDKFMGAPPTDIGFVNTHQNHHLHRGGNGSVPGFVLQPTDCFCPVAQNPQFVLPPGMNGSGLQQILPPSHNAGNKYVTKYLGPVFTVEQVQPNPQRQILDTNNEPGSLNTSQSHLLQAGGTKLPTQPQMVEDMAYVNKVRELGRKFREPLRRLINKTENEDPEKLKRMEDALKVLENPYRPMELLFKCETFLEELDFETEVIGTAHGIDRPSNACSYPEEQGDSVQSASTTGDGKIAASTTEQQQI